MWAQLLLWVISFVLTDYFRERLPSQTASGIGDFNIPTATEGRPVPIVTGGTVRLNAPNCIWYGDFVAVERTVTTGVIFKREETIGFKYELALQYALFKGESAGITGIWIGDDKVFDHVDDAGGVPQEFVDVDRDDLFGGEDNGGGFQGRVRLHKGSETQAVSAFLDTRLDPLPAYRGLSYVVISNIAGTFQVGLVRETIAAETRGATIGETNQLRYIRVEVQTFDTIANGGLGDTLSLGNDHHIIGPDLNPIAAAWDVWTNTRWGRGFGLGDINLASFQAAAETCFTDGIGWTNVQDEQTTTGAIQDKIEQHIDGYIGPNPLTGLIEVTLARPDYVIASLPLIDESNILEVKQWDQGDWSNTKNRIRIRYTSRSKDWKETHAVETAAGNRIIQGRTVTQEIRYEGVHTDSVAGIIAAREKRGLSIPLQKGTLLIDRVGYELKPGQPFRLTSSQAKTVDLPVRVTKITFGDMIRQSIEISVIEDIFGNEPSTVEETPAESDFVPPIQAVIALGVLDQAATEPPFILQQFDDLPGTTRRISTFARRNPGNFPTFYEVHRRTGNPPSGAFIFSEQVLQGFSAVGTLRNAELGGQTGQGTLSIQIDELTGESLDALIGVYDPRLGDARGIAVISPGTVDEEWIIFTAILDDGTGIQLDNVFRSALDTPWKSHAIGETVWFIWSGGMGLPLEVYGLNTQVEIKLLPANSEQVLAEASATALEIVRIDTATDDRTTKPLLPVELDINGAVFPAEVDFDGEIVPQSGPNYAGAQVIPAHRLATVADVRLSVEAQNALGVALAAADLADQALEISLWIFDLNQNPGAVRADALDSTINQAVVNPNDEIQIEKADLIAGGAIGLSFPARIEIETRYSPAGGAALNVSHEPLFFDFLATGNFSVGINDAVTMIHFDGVDTVTVVDATDAINQFVQFQGAAQIDTAQSVFGGSSLLLDGNDAFVRYPVDRRFDVRGAWTVECRIRFASDPGTTVEICGQMDGNGVDSWTIGYVPGNDRFEFGTSSTGTNGPFFTAITNANFVPAINTQYALAISRTAAGVWHVFIDGTRIGTPVTHNPTIFQSSCDLLIGARNFNNVTNAFFDGWIDEFRLTPFALYQGDYTIATAAFDDSRANYPLLALMEGSDMDVNYPTDDLTGFDLNITGTSEIDTSQSMFGSASLRCDGVNNIVTLNLNDGAWIQETVGAKLFQFSLLRSPFTMEAFIRFNALPSSTLDGMAILAKYDRPGGANAIEWYFYFNGNDDLVFVYSPLGLISSTVSLTSSDLGTLVTGVWYHAAAARLGNGLSLFFEGNRVGQNLTFYDGQPDMLNDELSNVPITIGRFYDSSVITRQRALNGWIDEVSISIGAKYDGATYTIPTESITKPRRVIVDRDDRDELIILDHFDGANFFATDHVRRSEDRLGARFIFGGGSNLELTPKFGTAALDCDGSGDSGQWHYSRANHRLFAADFTIDIQYRPDILPHNDGNGGHCLAAQWQTTGNLRSWAFYLDDAGTTTNLVFAWSVDGTVVKTAFVLGVEADIAILNYHHMQVGREGSTLRLWIEGVLQTLDGASDSIGTDIIFDAGATIHVGRMNDPSSRDLDGKLDEFRMLLRNTDTATFTARTAAYPNPLPIDEDPYF